MSQVIMLFLFPLGLYFYFFKERPAKPTYYKTFTDFEKHIQDSTTLLESEKIQYFQDMLLKNEYIIIETTPNTVIGEKKYLV